MANYSMVYVCENNRDLIPFCLKIPTYFYYIYEGRKIIKDRFEEEFPQPNGHYFEFPEYSDEDCIDFNLKVNIDKKGYTSSFSSYKMRDLGGGPRGSSVDVPYTKKDYKAINDLLNEVLENPGKLLFDKICSKLELGSELSNGFVFSKKTDKALEFKDANGKKKILKITKLLDNLSLVYKFIEIAYSEEFLHENQYYFEPELTDLYHSVFLLLDYKSLPNYKKLIKEANNRVKLKKALEEYDDLLKACRDNDVINAKKYIGAAKFVVTDNMEDDFPLLCAAKNDNYELAKMLLENGAFSIQIALQCGPQNPYKDFTELHNSGALSALYVATIHRNKDLMKLLIAYNGNRQYSDIYDYNIPYISVKQFRIDELLNYLIEKDDAESIGMIIENLKDSDHIYPIKFREDTELSLDDIKWFAEQNEHRIDWPSKLIAKAFNENKNLYHLMLKQCFDKYTNRIMISIDEATRQGDLELLKDLLQYNIGYIKDFGIIYKNAVNNGKTFVDGFVECIIENYDHFREEYIRLLLIELCNNNDFQNAIKMVDSIPLNFREELWHICFVSDMCKNKHSYEELNNFMEQLLPVLYSKKELYSRDGIIYCPLEHEIEIIGSHELWFKMITQYASYYDFNNIKNCMKLLKSIRDCRLVQDTLFEKMIDKAITLCETEKDKKDFFWLELEGYIKYFIEPDCIFPKRGGMKVVPKKKSSKLYRANKSRFNCLVNDFNVLALLKEKLSSLDNAVWENDVFYSWVKKNHPKETELLRLIRPSNLS